MKKTYTKCGIEKELSEFYKKLNKLTSACKNCIKINISNYRLENKEKVKEQLRISYINNKEKRNKESKKYYNEHKQESYIRNKKYREENKEELKKYLKEYHKKYYEENKEELNKKHSEYRKNNKEKQKIRSQKYYKENKEKIRKNSREYEANRISMDLNYKLRKRLRTRLYKAINNNYKAGSAVSDLGCSIEFLKSYLESKFKEGMTWDNHGTHGWHIDHIKPLSSFNLENRKELLEACNYRNLQPLWAKENLVKHSKY